ncbi:MAG TPA: di-heme oxidoredictase family protein [Planctomycetota bacterium]|nr:di-heme oxidoredictase family protein [Planctomycetota bacterium]
MRLIDVPVLSTTLAFLAASGAVATAQAPQPKMGAPLNGLSASQLQRFQAGRVDFTHTFQASEGLGPTFNQQSCASCHNNPIGGPGSIEVTRFGFFDPLNGFDPMTSLGGTLLQANTTNVACQEVVPPQANVTAHRVTPSALGIGLIEAIPDADIAYYESNPPSPSVSGRARMVMPLETPGGPMRVGRFGWKAQVATVLTFAGDASLNELGFTNRLVPTESAPNGNLALALMYDPVADPEDGPDAQGLDFIDRITNFQRYLAQPPQTPRSGMSGETIFHSVGCADCHIPSYTTSNDPALEAALRNKVVKPYSDFLLHDMGIAADFIGDGTADIQELRTPLLWGVRSRDPLWHDGRVTGGTFQDRIIGPAGIVSQHAAFGSEAAPSAAAFQALSFTDQLKVVAFLDSLGRAEFDWNGDNVLDHVDLAAFLLARGGGPYTPDDPEAVFDFNQDGAVDSIDLAAFALVYEEDCNSNNTNDLLDVLNGTSGDANGNYIPDECEHCQTSLGFAGAGTFTMQICGDHLTDTSSRATFQLRGGPANGMVLIGIGVAANPYLITPTEYLVPLEPLVAVVDLFTLDMNGELRLVLYGGGTLPVSNWIFQAATFTGSGYDLTNALSVDVGRF